MDTAEQIYASAMIYAEKKLRQYQAEVFEKYGYYDGSSNAIDRLYMFFEEAVNAYAARAADMQPDQSGQRLGRLLAYIYAEEVLKASDEDPDAGFNSDLSYTEELESIQNNADRAKSAFSVTDIVAKEEESVLDKKKIAYDLALAYARTMFGYYLYHQSVYESNDLETATHRLYSLFEEAYSTYLSMDKDCFEFSDIQSPAVEGMADMSREQLLEEIKRFTEENKEADLTQNDDR